MFSIAPALNVFNEPAPCRSLLVKSYCLILDLPFVQVSSNSASAKQAPLSLAFCRVSLFIVAAEAIKVAPTCAYMSAPDGRLACPQMRLGLERLRDKNVQGSPDQILNCPR